MPDVLEKPDVAMPSREDAEIAAESSRILAKAAVEDGLRVRLGDGTEMALPKAVTRLLTHILTETANGNAVTLIPIHAELTTQEAADFLNVSRPHLIKLLERREIAFRMVGTHRRIRFDDLKRYKLEKDHEADDAIDELVRQAQDYGMGY